MQQPFAFPFGRDATRFGAAGFNPALRGFGTATRTAQTLGIEWFDWFKQSCDDMTAAAARLAAARTPAEVLSVQTAFFLTAAERFSARAPVLAGLTMTLAADLVRPVGSAGAARAG